MCPMVDALSDEYPFVLFRLFLFLSNVQNILQENQSPSNLWGFFCRRVSIETHEVGNID